MFRNQNRNFFLRAKKTLYGNQSFINFMNLSEEQLNKIVHGLTKTNRQMSVLGSMRWPSEYHLTSKSIKQAMHLCSQLIRKINHISGINENTLRRIPAFATLYKKTPREHGWPFSVTASFNFYGPNIDHGAKKTSQLILIISTVKNTEK